MLFRSIELSHVDRGGRVAPGEVYGVLLVLANPAFVEGQIGQEARVAGDSPGLVGGECGERVAEAIRRVGGRFVQVRSEKRR